MDEPIFYPAAFTAVLALIGYFIKRYIDNTDKRADEYATMNKESLIRLTNMIESLKEVIVGIRLSDSQLRTTCYERHKNLDEKLRRYDKDFGDLYDKHNSTQDKISDLKTN